MAGSSKAPLVDLEAGNSGASGGYGATITAGIEGLGSRIGRIRDLLTSEAETTPEDEVKVVGEGGESKSVKVKPELPGWMQRFGITEPPGGWYGPFGFLRLVAYAFLVITLLSALCLIYTLIFEKDLVNLVTSTILIPGAFIGALAALSHEGLAKQVTATAKQNEAFGSMNEDFQKRLSGLASVKERFDRIGAAKEEQIKGVDAVLEGLKYVDHLNTTTVLLRAFTDAETQQLLVAGEHGNMLLNETSEIMSFYQAINATVKSKLPNTEMKGLAKLIIKAGGIHLRDLSLLIAAVTSQVPKESEVFMALLELILDPTTPERKEEAFRLLSWHLQPRTDIDKELTRMLDAVGGGKRVPVEAEEALLYATLEKFQAVEDEKDEQDEEMEMLKQM